MDFRLKLMDCEKDFDGFWMAFDGLWMAVDGFWMACDGF